MRKKLRIICFGLITEGQIALFYPAPILQIVGALTQIHQIPKKFFRFFYSMPQTAGYIFRLLLKFAPIFKTAEFCIWILICLFRTFQPFIKNSYLSSAFYRVNHFFHDLPPRHLPYMCKLYSST